MRWVLSRSPLSWQAEEFHSLVHSFLGRLTESEKTLKYGVFPEEEAAVQECQAQLQVGASPHQPLPAPGGLQPCPRTPNTGVSWPPLGWGILIAGMGCWVPPLRGVGCLDIWMFSNTLKWGDLGLPTPIH